MHERSLVAALLEQVRELAREHRASAVEEISVSIGPLSGVEPLLVSSAFEQLAQDRMLAGARLVLEQTPLCQQCQACSATFESERLDFTCPECGSHETRITAGDGVILRSVSLSAQDAPPQGKSAGE